MKTRIRCIFVFCFLAILTGCGSDEPSVFQDQPADPSTPPVANPGDPVSSGSNRLTYEGQSRVLDSGIVDIINSARGHLEVDFNISDSEFQIGFYNIGAILYSYWFAPNDTVALNVDLYSASIDTLVAGDYEYVDISEIRDGNSTVGQSVFSQASVGWDFNGDGNVDDDEELDIVDGVVRLNIDGISETALQNASMSWDVLLVNGRRATGSYSGGFTIVE